MTNKELWNKMNDTHTTDKTYAACQKLGGGSIRYGVGGKWSKDGKNYLSLGGNLSRGGMPLKLKCKDVTCPISNTDLGVLVAEKYVIGVSPVEFE